MNRRSATVLLLLALALFVVSNLTGSESKPDAAPSETALERFPIAKNAYFLLVPVEIKGKRYQFVLDTGSSSTIFDQRLRHLLSQQLGWQKVETPHGIVNAPLFQAPEAKVGRLLLPKGTFVTVTDFEKMRQAGDNEMSGVIGMDFLGRHILRIDFDRGEVVFLRSVGPNPGERLPLSFRYDRPHISIQIDEPDDPELFMLDTGLSGHHSGNMSAALFDALIAKKKMSSLVKLRSVGFSGVVQDGRQGQMDCLLLAGHRHKGLRFMRAEINVLGLRFCSRYVMTCDFPNRLLYLKKRHRFDWPDKQNLSGLHIFRIKGEIQVDAVDEGSPAALAGIRSCDVLLTVNGKKVSELSLFDVRERFCSAGEQLRLVVRQGAQQREVSLMLSKTD